MKAILPILIAAFAALAINAAAHAADAGYDSYYPDFPADDAMKPGVPAADITTKLPQYGFWITPTVISQKKGGSEMTSSVITTRVWLKTYLWPYAYVYARGKYMRTDVLRQRGSSDSSSNLVDLDLGFITAGTPKNMFEISAGRKYFILGTGLLFNGRGDGMDVNLRLGLVQIKGFACYSGWLVKQDNPYGLSDRDISTGAKRFFAGGSATFDVYNQHIYVQYLSQMDFQNLKYSVTNPNFRLKYDSQYYGIGVHGVIVERLSYYAEFDYQTGKSYLSGAYFRNNIRAYASNIGLSYYFRATCHPVIIAQYAMGSGDRDRKDARSPAGNNNGEDHGFLYFGTYTGGLGLRPILNNLHVIRGGAAFSPFSWADPIYVRSMTIVAKYSAYVKHRNAAPLNYGFDAIRRHRFAGHGVDVSLRWLIVSDVGVFFNYAAFLPGDAFYAIESNRHFYMGGLNISF